jgi:hypothetical protein
VESGVAYDVLFVTVVLKELSEAVKVRSRPDRSPSQRPVLWTGLLCGYRRYMNVMCNIGPAATTSSSSTRRLDKRCTPKTY